MVVKELTGRRRYIVFHAPEPAPARHELNQQVGIESARLTVYEDGIGILKVAHTDVAQARDRLTELGAKPLTTSGTIKRAKRHVGLVGV